LFDSFNEPLEASRLSISMNHHHSRISPRTTIHGPLYISIDHPVQISLVSIRTGRRAHTAYGHSITAFLHGMQSANSRTHGVWNGCDTYISFWSRPGIPLSAFLLLAWGTLPVSESHGIIYNTHDVRAGTNPARPSVKSKSGHITLISQHFLSPSLDISLLLWRSL
jgi:hypothetical protein